MFPMTLSKVKNLLMSMLLLLTVGGGRWAMVVKVKINLVTAAVCSVKEDCLGRSKEGAL